MAWMIAKDDTQYLAHHGIKGQKWGIRRYQNADGTLTPEGKERYKKRAELYLKTYYRSSVLQEGPYKGKTRYINSKRNQQGSVEFLSDPGKIDVDKVVMAKKFDDMFYSLTGFKELNDSIKEYAQKYTTKPNYVKPLDVTVEKDGGLVTYVDNNDNWYEVDYNPFTKKHGEIKFKGNY